MVVVHVMQVVFSATSLDLPVPQSIDDEEEHGEGEGGHHTTRH